MAQSQLTHLVLVGGFLGAGKTSLILAAARLLSNRGARVAIVANDQGGELVDTRLAQLGGFATGEVTGGCFCCRFSDFVDAAEKLMATQPDVIFAEPVGSCMDISATTLQPLKRLCGDRFRLAPFTVLVDPARARQLLAPGADADLAYLFSKQLHEADLVYFTRADIDDDPPTLPGGAAGRLSSASGFGVAEWLDLILGGEVAAGAHLLDVDYARYAEAEAALGWLNWQVRLHLDQPLSPSLVAGPLVDALQQSLEAERAAIAHLKVLSHSAAGWVRVSICGAGAEPSPEGDLAASPARRHELSINLRAKAAPELLDALVERAVDGIAGKHEIVQRQAFRPGEPRPEHRDRQVV